jgi:hypothetical protein
MMLTALLIGAMQSGSAPEITVYNQGFALVKENRSLELKQGRQTAIVENVAQQIDTTSVRFRPLNDTNGLFLLEQNYRFDLISPQAILARAVGTEIKFIRYENGQTITLEGTLLSAPTAIVSNGGNNYQTYNGMVIKDSRTGEIVLDPVGTVVVKNIPDGLISKPSLLWDLDSAKAGKYDVELSYITQGMNWTSDYVLTLNDGSKADLQGWATLTNQSGTSFKDAKLKLLAGDVNRVPAAPGAGGENMAFMAKASRAADFAEESLFEYHLYTLQRPTTVQNNETKQVSLLEGSGVPYTKKLIVDATRNFGRYYPSEGTVGEGNIEPQVRVEFSNRKKDGLGMPMPAGRIRVYQRDQSGSIQFIGEDRIKHTPKDESLSLVLGRSFDVVASRKRTNYRKLSDRAYSETFEIEVRNRKETAETVHVFERHWGDWRVTEKNQEFVKLDSNTMDFTVNLKANEVKKVVYTVETRW